MNDYIIGACMVAVVVAAWIGYYCGKSDKKGELDKSWNKTITAECKYNSLHCEFVTVEKVRHNLNCLVGDLKHERDQQAELKQEARGNLVTAENLLKGLERENGILHKGVAKLENTIYHRRKQLKVAYDKHRGLEADVRLYKADAAAWNQSKGLWCTDQPDLIKFNAKKERFFRLGYPEHKL